MNDSLHRNRKIGEEEHVYARSLVAIEFMQGAMLALDSVKKLGMSANLHVYETDNSQEQVKVIMGKPELKEADLIIGPLFRSNFELMSEFAKEQKINIVSPVPQSNKVLLGNEYVSKVYPSSITQVQQLAKYVATRHKTHNIVIIDSKSKGDQAILNAFTNKLNKTLYQNDTARYIKPVQIGYISGKNILPHIDGDTVNAFVIPSTNQVFVTNIVTKLNGLQRRNKIMLYGMDEWQDFTSIDYEYFNNLQVHLVTPNYIDYDTVKTQQYISLFRNKYGTDPGKYGMLGFDVTLYYLLALKEHGTGFRKKLEEMKYEGVCTSFGFFKAGIENGYENQSVYIVRYSDFNLLLAE